MYTPGFFVNGKEWKRRFGTSAISSGDRGAGNLQATLSDHTLKVSYDSSTPISTATLNVGILGFGYETAIQSGENSNRTLIEDFVLLSHSEHLSSNQSWQVTLPDKVAPSAEKYGLAIWVSNGTSLIPLQTTGGWLPDSYY